MALQVMLYQLSACAISDIGLTRQNNEDYWKLLKNEQFFVLADGMGGHQAGEVASKETVEMLCYLFQKDYLSFYREEINRSKQLLKQIIQEINTAVHRLGRENSILRGMGTTLCCIGLHPNGLIYAHVGDSRIYRLRHGHLEQLTQDHSLLRELIDLGQLSEQQAGDFLYKNIITKAIGTESFVEPTVAHTSLEPNDIFLMCTDGLSDLISLFDMQELMNQHPIEESVHLLVDKAKQNGGYDNITVILVKVENKHESYLS